MPCYTSLPTSISLKDNVPKQYSNPVIIGNFVNINDILQ